MLSSTFDEGKPRHKLRDTDSLRGNPRGKIQRAADQSTPVEYSIGKRKGRPFVNATSPIFRIASLRRLSGYVHHRRRWWCSTDVRPHEPQLNHSVVRRPAILRHR